jgi:hypothetical protein
VRGSAVRVDEIGWDQFPVFFLKIGKSNRLTGHVSTLKKLSKCDGFSTRKQVSMAAASR